MAGPWEKYQTEAQAGPWTKYASGEPSALPQVAPKAATQGKGLIASAIDYAKKDIAAIPQRVGDLAAGAVRGAGSIGATILAPYDMAMDALDGKGLSLESNRQRRAAIDGGLREMGANTDSTQFKVGKLGAEIAGTAGVGNLLGAGARAVGAAPGVVNALTTGGFQAANLPANATRAARVGNQLLRAAGGAVTGGVTAGLINPEDAGVGAAIGGVLPLGVSALGKVGSYAGRTANSLMEPFTSAGQEAIAGRVLRRFADGGPVNIDTAQIVPGSIPTLAEATGNAGLATLQRGARDLRPNAFIDREAKNAAARLAAIDSIAGDDLTKAAAMEAREQAAGQLYGKAFTADAMRRDLAKSAQEARAPFAGVGLSARGEDLATPGLRELTSRPMFKQAVQAAKELAANKGVRLDDPLQSLEGLHFVKLALDDMANPAAASSMGKNANSAINDMRGKLAEELAQISPLYGNARQTFAEMSVPVNQMEALQGLRLTDAQGNITLAKIQNAIAGLEKARAKPGLTPAKSLNDEQLRTLYAIRDDLLRQTNLGLGRSVGSNTFQNLATDNILRTATGNGVSRIADKLGIAGLAGQAGRLVYSGPNEAIRNRLVDLMLDPAAAQAAMNPAAPQVGAMRNALNALADQSLPLLYRSAPALSTSR